MKKRIKQGILLVIGTSVITFFLYDSVVLYLTNTYKKELCVEDYCIQKPKDWLPLFVKREGNTYMYDTFLKNDTELGKIYFEDDRNGIVLTRGDADIVFMKYTKSNGINKKVTPEYHIGNETYYMSKNYGSHIVIIFPKLNFGFSISGTTDTQDLVEHFILTSTKPKL